MQTVIPDQICNENRASLLSLVLFQVYLVGLEEGYDCFPKAGVVCIKPCRKLGDQNLAHFFILCQKGRDEGRSGNNKATASDISEDLPNGTRSSFNSAGGPRWALNALLSCTLKGVIQ